MKYIKTYEYRKHSAFFVGDYVLVDVRGVIIKARIINGVMIFDDKESSFYDVKDSNGELIFINYSNIRRKLTRKEIDVFKMEEDSKKYKEFKDFSEDQKKLFAAYIASKKYSL